jgi:phage shock protein PspC (stress-responsive transcriptional regulator)
VRQGLQYIGAKSGFNTDVTLIGIIGLVIKTILGLVGVLALIVTIWSGIQWITSSGNEEKISSAKKTLIGAVIGLLVIVVSYAIVSFVMDKLTATGAIAPP